jgi:hypothetical protein
MFSYSLFGNFSMITESKGGSTVTPVELEDLQDGIYVIDADGGYVTESDAAFIIEET